MTLRDIGRRIRSRRQQRGISQSQLALSAKLSQPAIARIERGQVNPQWHSLERVAAALGSGICELVCGRARQSNRASKLALRAAAILDSRDDLAINLLLNGVAGAEGVLSRAPARLPRRGRSAGARKLVVREPAVDPGHGFWQAWRDED